MLKSKLSCKLVLHSQTVFQRGKAVWLLKTTCKHYYSSPYYSEVVAVEDRDSDHQNDSSSEEETTQEKRIRLAKEYIAELEEQGTSVQGLRL